MEGIVTYRRKDKKKIRTITTYSSSKKGKELKEKHNKIKDELYRLFEQEKSIHTYAYEKNSNTKKMVLEHIDSRFFLKADIYSFFDSISHEKLLTKIPTTEINMIEVVKDCSCRKDKGIAIGLIPSPILANIYLSKFDKDLGEILLKIGGLVYTRYADDIIISSINAFDKQNILEIMKYLLLKEGLYLNNSKVEKKDLERKGSHVKITGLNIVRGENGNYITVSRKFKKEMKKDKKFIRKRAKERYVDYNEYQNNEPR